MANIAIVVAIENYKDSHLKPVKFGEADAIAFADAIQLHGFASVETILGSDASKATIESRVRTITTSLSPGDRFFFYYAGHGFSSTGSNNYLTCHDSVWGDLENTSINLQWLFKQVDQSDSDQVALFLDCCHSGITQMSNERGILDHLSDEEVKHFFKAAEHKACFSSCKGTQKSYSDPTLKHGVWTFHLIEAITGIAPAALENKRYLTAQSLQNYLSQQVPLSARKARSDKPNQTPMLYSLQTSDFLLFDLQQLFERQAAEVDQPYTAVKSASFQHQETVRIRSLGGFKKGSHKEPTWRNYTTQSFVEKISQTDIDATIEDVYKKLRENMGFKRQQLAASSGKIVCADFEYTVSCFQDESDPSEAVFVEELSGVEPQILQKAEFNQIFDKKFDELTVQLDGPINVAKIIDAVESAEMDGVELEYPSDCSSCTLSFDSSFSMTICDGHVVVSAPQRTSPLKLVEGLLDVKKILLSGGQLHLLPFPGQ